MSYYINNTMSMGSDPFAPPMMNSAVITIIIESTSR